MGYKHLKVLRLWCSVVLDEGCHSLVDFLADTNNTTCGVIELMGDRIGSEGCRALSKCFSAVSLCNVQVLTLDFNPIGDEGLFNLMKATAYPPNLEELSLQNCSLGNESMGYVGEWLEKEGCSLVILKLNENSIGNEGFNVLSKYLLSNTSLKYLDLTQNLIGNNKETFEMLRNVMEDRKNLIAYLLTLNLFVPEGVSLSRA